jgi:hypothetical protein
VSLVTSEKIGAVSAHTVCGMSAFTAIVVPRKAKLKGFPARGPEVIRA